MTEQSTLLSHSTDDTSMKYMLKLAAPMIITNISFTIMQFVDRFMVSRLGTDALAAILPAGLISFIPAGFAVGLFASVATFVSQSLGRNEKNNCSNYCWQSIYIGLIYSVFVVVIMWPAAPAIFKLMGHAPEVAKMEVVYLRIMLYANLVAVFIWTSTQFFMGIHRPVITMYAAICAQAVNVLANYTLIFGKFGFPEMGIAGAGWGSLIGITVGAAIRMTMFLSPGINAEFKTRKNLRVDFRKMLDLLKVGLPAGFELMLNVALWGTILFWLVGKFGKQDQAATSAVLSCTHLSIMPIVGIKMALGVAVGKAIGAGKKNVAIKQTQLCLKIALAYMGLVGILFFIFRHPIMAFWSSDNKVIETGTNILICAAIYQVFHATRTIYSGALRGAGDTLWLAIVSALGAIVVLGLGGLATIKLFPQLGSLGPWLTATFSIIVVGMANRWRFKSNKWKQIDLFKRKPIGASAEIEVAAE
ncbi:MAG: MATE family efflux transporter [Planctomycetes bacterium]|nr:MATE family efflux transporter [Planctomycetota bacterium]